MYCIIKCIVQGKQARVKNADLHHPSCTVVMLKRKSASPILSVLAYIRNNSGPRTELCGTLCYTFSHLEKFGQHDNK